MRTLKNHREKMSVHVNVCMSKVMCTPVKVGVHMYATYANSRTLKSLSLPRNLLLLMFGKFLILFSDNLLVLMALRCCRFLNFFKNFNIDDSRIFLPAVPFKTNLKLHKIHVSPKLVKKIITDLDSSKASGPHCIPVVVLRNFDPEILYMLAEFFNMYLKESCRPDC